MRGVGDFGRDAAGQRRDNESSTPMRPASGNPVARRAQDVTAGGATLGDVAHRGDGFEAGEWDGTEERTQDFEQRLRGALGVPNDRCADLDKGDKGERDGPGEDDPEASIASSGAAALAALFQPLPQTARLAEPSRREAGGARSGRVAERQGSLDATNTDGPVPSIDVRELSSDVPRDLRVLAESDPAAQAATMLRAPLQVVGGAATIAIVDASTPAAKIEEIANRIERSIDADVRPAGPITIGIPVDPSVHGLAGVTVTFTPTGLDVVLERAPGVQASDSLIGAAHELVARLQKRFPRGAVRVLEATDPTTSEASHLGPSPDGRLA